MSISIANSAMLLRLRIGGKTFETSDKKLAEELTTSKAATSDSAKVAKRLLGGKCKLLQEVQKIAAATRAGVVNRTLPYHMGGVYMVSVDSWEETVTYVKQQQKAYGEALERFLAALPDIIEKAKKDLGELLDGSELYPSIDSLRQKFAFEYHLEPLPDGNLFDKVLDLGGQEDYLKQEMENQFADTIQQAVEALKERVNERVSQLVDRLDRSDQKRIRYKDLLRSTDSMMDTVLSLNITNDAHIIDWVNRVKNAIDHDPDVVRDDPMLRNTMSYELNKVLTEIGGNTPTPEPEPEPEQETESDMDEALRELIS